MVKSVSVGDVRLAVEDRGSGPPVLLVHAFPLNHSMWDALAALLEGRCRVIAPDLRGFGRSDVTDGTVTMGQFADDLAGLLDALEVAEPVVLCGLSMGGYIAFEFWRRHGRRVRALVLCDTRAAPDAPEAAANRLQTAQRVLEEGPGFLAETMIPKLLAPKTLRDRPEIVEGLRQVMLSTDPRGIAAAQRGMAARADATPLLPHLDCPTLLVVGQHDAISPVAEMQSIAGQIPRARLVTISNAGHLAPAENPDEVHAALAAFLAGL
jgi:pimeloyl-ACP methyl ester carboxylesterase